MNNLNSILLEGNLVRDPELGYTGKGMACCKFALANNRYFKQEEEYQEETSFFNITTWGKQAEACSGFLKKGRGVRVIGRLKQDRWKDQEGNSHTRVYIVAEHVEFKPSFRKTKERLREEIIEEINKNGHEINNDLFSKKQLSGNKKEVPEEEAVLV